MRNPCPVWNSDQNDDFCPKDLTIDDLMSEEWFHGNPLNAQDSETPVAEHQNSHEDHQYSDDDSSDSDSGMPPLLPRDQMQDSSDD